MGLGQEEYSNRIKELRMKGLENAKNRDWHFEEMAYMAGKTPEEYVKYEQGDKGIDIEEYKKLVKRLEKKMEEIDKNTRVKDEEVGISLGDIKGLEKEYGVRLQVLNVKTYHDRIDSHLKISITLKMSVDSQTKRFKVGNKLREQGWVSKGKERDRFLKTIILRNKR